MIFFNVPEARKELTSKGLVYTLRSSFRGTGETDAVVGSMSSYKRLGSNKRLSRVIVNRIKKINHPDDLYPYLHHSGFSTVDTWLAKASPSARTLYKVEMKDKIMKGGG